MDDFRFTSVTFLNAEREIFVNTECRFEQFFKGSPWLVGEDEEKDVYQVSQH